MIFSKLFGARVVEIRTETCRALCRAIVLSAVALCVFGTLQVAEARGLRPLIYKPDDAARTATAARLRDAEQKHQALKFDAPDFMNIEAKVLGAGHKSTAAAQKTGTVAARNPVDVIAAMVAAIVAPKAVAQEAPGGPQVTGAWQTLPYLMPINPIHMCMLHNGNILIVAGSENEPAEEGVSSKAAIWWLGSGTFTEWDNMPWDLFCNGEAALPDGRIFIRRDNTI